MRPTFKSVFSSNLSIALVFLLGSEAVSSQVPQRDPFPKVQLQNSFGFNLQLNSGTINDISGVKAAGSNLVRFPMMWWNVEKVPGHYDFSSFDAILQAFKDQGVRPVVFLAFGNPLYGDSYSVRGADAIAAFARFAYAAAERYQSNDVIWEIWNEPNLSSFWRPKGDYTEYMALLQATVPAIRQADPTALIIGPALSNTVTPFMASCIRAGILGLVDGVSIHPYQGAKYPEALENELKGLQGWIKKYKPIDKQVPVVFTEWGYSTPIKNDFDRGNFLIREALFGLNHNIPINIWYNFRDPVQCNAPKNCWGILANNSAPSPVYNLFQAFAKALDGYRYVSQTDMNNKNIHCLLFTNGTNQKLVAWTSESIDALGNIIPLELDNVILPNGGSVHLSGTPSIFNW
jgi:hypothetical protein